jgi:hypothetical protein
MTQTALNTEIPVFDNEDAVYAYLGSIDSCVDNKRIADIGQPDELQAYVRAQSRGCCGQHDEVAWVGFTYNYTTTKGEESGTYHKLCLIGCNYGH